MEATPDAVELQIRDRQGAHVPISSLSAGGGELRCSSYGLIADGMQHPVWVLFVDDPAVCAQHGPPAALTHAPWAGVCA